MAASNFSDIVNRSIQQDIQKLPPPEWVRGMVSHYQRTGAFRAHDLRHLLGDPTKSVIAGPRGCIQQHFCIR